MTSFRVDLFKLSCHDILEVLLTIVSAGKTLWERRAIEKTTTVWIWSDLVVFGESNLSIYPSRPAWCERREWSGAVTLGHWHDLDQLGV
jgi:hypothetical protein